MSLIWVSCWHDVMTGVVGSERAGAVRTSHQHQQHESSVNESSVSRTVRSHCLWWLQLTSVHVAIPTVVTWSPWWRHTRQPQTHLPVHWPGKQLVFSIKPAARREDVQFYVLITYLFNFCSMRRRSHCNCICTLLLDKLLSRFASAKHGTADYCSF